MQGDQRTGASEVAGGFAVTARRACEVLQRTFDEEETRAGTTGLACVRYKQDVQAERANSGTQGTRAR